MPAFRNVKITRSTARTIQYDDQGWQKYTPDHIPKLKINTRGRSVSRSPSPEAAYSPESYAPSPSPSPPPPTPKPKSGARKGRASEYVPRPRNAFIFFRSHFLALHKGKQDQNWISVQAGLVWKSLSQAEKQPFLEQADEEKAAHKMKHPNYIYAPGSKSYAGRRRVAPKKKPQAARRIAAAIAPASPPADVKMESRSPSLEYTPSPILADTPELSDDNSSRHSSEELQSPVDDYVHTEDIPELTLPPLLDENKAEQLVHEPDHSTTQPLPPSSQPGNVLSPATGRAYRASDSQGCLTFPPEEPFHLNSPLPACPDIQLDFDYLLKELPQAAYDGRLNYSDVFAFAQVDGLKAHDPHAELIAQLEEPVHCPATEQLMNDFIDFDPSH